MIIYADSSALAKLVIEEDGSEEFAALVAAADGVVTVSISQVEVFAALAAARRDGRLDAESHDQAKVQAGNLLAEVGAVDIDPALLQIACEVAETRALRAYDAVQLGALLGLEKQGLIFACWDDSLRAAATLEGIELFPQEVVGP